MQIIAASVAAFAVIMFVGCWLAKRSEMQRWQAEWESRDRESLFDYAWSIERDEQ